MTYVLKYPVESIILLLRFNKSSIGSAFLFILRSDPIRFDPRPLPVNTGNELNIELGEVCDELFSIFVVFSSLHGTL